ncbi:MAG: ABC transporter ATP-binding protein [Chloroflexota bacterium]
MSTALAFSGIRKVFHSRQGDVEAIRDVSLEVEEHSFTAVVGPSGCGKTTLLHIAAGLDTQFEGRLTQTADVNRTAYLFQTPRLLPWLTVEANVAFVREAHGEAKREALHAARRYLDLVGLGGFERQYPLMLSGGMQQRVALARALAVEPEVMLMDEPFAALDELTARRLRGELLQLHAAQPHTVLFVTHNVTEAAFLADRVIVMSARPGVIVADIPVDLVRPRDYDDPAIALLARQIVQHLHMS